MNDIVVKTWDRKHKLTMKEDCFVLYWFKHETVIPLNQVISITVKDPKGDMRPGMITIKLGGSTSSFVKLNSFLTVGNSNDIQFPHSNEYTAQAQEMKKYFSTYKAGGTTSTPALSAADEIKKYKELLDMGAITQEEYDLKKKQLLGL